MLWSCVTTQQIELIEREQRRLRSENTEIRQEASLIRKEMDAIRTSLADTRANLQQLQREIGTLRGGVDEVRHLTEREVGQSAREGEQRIRDLEQRLAKLDGDLKSQGQLLKSREEELRLLRETIQRGGMKGPGDLAGEKGPPAESEAVRRDYEEAWKLMEGKDYRVAIGRFREFVKKYPESDLADNAQYWIGEGFYALKEFDQAILEFDAVRRKYPNGDKVPAALLKQGFAFAELGDKVDARLILQELIARFPKSEEAAKAKQKLKALES